MADRRREIGSSFARYPPAVITPTITLRAWRLKGLPELCPAMFELRRIHKSYRIGTHQVNALNDLSLEISDGEFVAIMGPSGSGKSTLLHIIGLLDTPDSGEYFFAGQRMCQMTETDAARWRSRTFGYVFQSFHLLPFKTALENVCLPLLYQGHSRKLAERRGLECLERLGLREWGEHRPTAMSSGQQQRVAIARALVTHPRAILADEPTGALDSHTSTEVIGLLRELNKNEGITTAMVTHDMNTTKCVDRIIAISDGQVLSGGLG